jgi:hypothetical protein
MFRSKRENVEVSYPYLHQLGGSNGKKYKYRPMKELLVSFYEKTMIDQRTELHAVFENCRQPKG